jgi:predicted RNA-binding protein YlxR (DUF448 family)
VGCGRKAEKTELVRFVARDGVVTYDATGRSPGRGAYTCRRVACLERATARRAFARTLRQAVEVPGDLQGVYGER